MQNGARVRSREPRRKEAIQTEPNLTVASLDSEVRGGYVGKLGLVGRPLLDASSFPTVQTRPPFPVREHARGWAIRTHPLSVLKKREREPEREKEPSRSRWSRVPLVVCYRHSFAVERKFFFWLACLRGVSALGKQASKERISFQLRSCACNTQ